MIHHLGIALIALAAVSTPAAAQGGHEPTDVHLRNNCRLAAQVLTTGQPAPKRKWARDFISNCAESGPAVLVQLWQQVPADTAKVNELIGMSARLRDQRLFDQAAALVRDRSRPEVVRTGAMILLAQYADPSWGVSFPLLLPPENRPSGHVWLILGGHSFHDVPQLKGTIPMPKSVAQPVVEILKEVAATEQNPRVWYAAAALARTLESDLQEDLVQ